MFNLNNKTFVITGTSSGIGFHLASNICKLKCKVIGISRKKTLINHKNFKNINGDINSINDIGSFSDIALSANFASFKARSGQV